MKIMRMKLFFGWWNEMTWFWEEGKKENEKRRDLLYVFSSQFTWQSLYDTYWKFDIIASWLTQ